MMIKRNWHPEILNQPINNSLCELRIYYMDLSYTITLHRSYCTVISEFHRKAFFSYLPLYCTDWYTSPVPSWLHKAIPSHQVLLPLIITSHDWYLLESKPISFDMEMLVQYFLSPLISFCHSSYAQKHVLLYFLHQHASIHIPVFSDQTQINFKEAVGIGLSGS